MSGRPELVDRAEKYAKGKGLTIGAALGSGYQPVGCSGAVIAPLTVSSVLPPEET